MLVIQCHSSQLYLQAYQSQQRGPLNSSKHYSSKPSLSSVEGAVTSSSPRPSQVQRWFWQIACTTCAIVSASAGLAASLWLPDPTQAIATGQGEELATANGFMSPIARPINVLVMGVDRVPEAEPGSPESFTGRSDTLLLLHLDPRQEAVSVLSIPRDTQVEVPNYGLTKINHANWMGGPALIRSVLQHNFNDVPVDRYIRVNTGAFREIVDAVGGVRVFVPKPMQYTDNTQGLKIDLAEGWQTLNGDQAEQFARFRHDEYGDIGRVQRQQTLLKALRKRLTQPTIVARVPQLLDIFGRYVDTNLSSEEMLALVRFGLKLTPEELKMVMLPGRASEVGEFNASYWLMDEDKRDQILADYFDTKAIARTYTGWDDVSTERSPYDIRIAVQNASLEEDQGYRMAESLRELGFSDVYVVDDWPDINSNTEIIVQQGDLKAADLVRDRLGLGQVDSASTGDLESEITVRVGSDWHPPTW